MNLQKEKGVKNENLENLPSVVQSVLTDLTSIIFEYNELYDTVQPSFERVENSFNLTLNENVLNEIAAKKEEFEQHIKHLKNTLQ